MVQNPVKRCGAEDSIEAVPERQSDQVGSNEADAIAKVWLKILPRVQHHVARKIEADDASPRKILQEKAGQFPGAAARVEQTLIAAQPKFAENALSPLKLRRGEAMVFGGIPFPGICGSDIGSGIHPARNSRSFASLRMTIKKEFHSP